MDFSKVRDDLALEVIRSAEALLSGQVTIATSADQRAAVMASVFAAAGAALVAGTITILSGNHPIAVVAGGTTAGAFFLAGAACCVKATMPSDFYLPGNQPRDWKKDVSDGRALIACLGEQADHLQARIDFNNGIITENALWFKRGAWLGIVAPFAGALVWGLMTLGKLAG